MKKLILILFIFSLISCKEKISTTIPTSISSATVNGVKEFCGSEGGQLVRSAGSRSSSADVFYGITENGSNEIVLKDENGNVAKDVVIKMIYNIGQDFCYVETYIPTDSYQPEIKNNYVFSKKSGKGIKATLGFRDIYGYFAFIDNYGNTYIRATATRTEGMSIITENGIIKLSQDAKGDNISIEMLPKSKTRGMMLVNKFGTLYEATGEMGYVGYYPNRFCSSEYISRSGNPIYTSVFASHDTDELFEFENGKFTKISKSGETYIRTFVVEYAKEGFIESNVLQDKNSFYIIKEDCSEIMRINSDGTHSVYPTDMQNDVERFEFIIYSRNMVQLGKYLITRGRGEYIMVNLENGEVTPLPEIYGHGIGKPSADGKCLYYKYDNFLGYDENGSIMEYFVSKWDLETRTFTEIIKSSKPIKVMGNDFRE